MKKTEPSKATIKKYRLTKWYNVLVSQAIITALRWAEPRNNALLSNLAGDGLILKGYAPADSASGSTHADGCAVDIGTKPLSDALVKGLLTTLRSAGFCAVFRPIGYKPTGGSVTKTEHIHAIWPGHGNSGLIAAETQPGARANDRLMLDNRDAYHAQPREETPR